MIKEKQTPLFVDLPDSPLPPLHLLDEPVKKDVEVLSSDTLEFTSRLIERKLIDFGVEVKVVAAYPGPVITRYEIEPAIGWRENQILNLVKDFARPVGGEHTRGRNHSRKDQYGFEPNRRQVVRLSEILSSQVCRHGVAVDDRAGQGYWRPSGSCDQRKCPTFWWRVRPGCGKSVAINAMILSLLYKAPEQVRLILVDPKMLELSVYEGIPHLLAPVVTDMRQAAKRTVVVLAEMERRYKRCQRWGQSRRLQSKSGGEGDEKPLTNLFSLTPDTLEPLEEMPLIVVVLDELADLMMVQQESRGVDCTACSKSSSGGICCWPRNVLQST